MVGRKCEENNMDFRDLLCGYYKYCELRCSQPRVVGKKLSKSHIEDENQSVKWNREFVEQHNKDIDNQLKQHREKINKAFNDYIDSIIKAIMDELNCDSDTAVKIYDYVYGLRDWEDGEEDKLDAIEELVELIKDIREDI
jgi:hypothetical protein